MFNTSTLKGQVAICILWAWPLPAVMLPISNFLSWLLNLLIPPVVFCVLFWNIKDGRGSKFRVTRIIIAMFLWTKFWAVIFTYFNVIYYAVAIALTVILSYAAGNLINYKANVEKTLFNSSTLKGQMLICILWSLPIPILIRMSFRLPFFLQISTLLIPLTIFLVLFGGIQNGKGSEFKIIRTIIAILLWGAFWTEYFIMQNFKLLSKTGDLSYQLRHDYGFDIDTTIAVLEAAYNVIAVALVVILSYVIGKWIWRHTYILAKIKKWYTAKLNKTT